MKKEYRAAQRACIKGDLLKNRRTQGLCAAGLVLMLGSAPAGIACAETTSLGVPDKIFPESVTSTRDGTLFVGSFNLGGVTKVAPDGKTEQLIKPGENGSRSTLGVLAHEASGTLYVCSNDMSG